MQFFDGANYSPKMWRGGAQIYKVAYIAVVQTKKSGVRPALAFSQLKTSKEIMELALIRKNSGKIASFACSPLNISRFR